MIITIVPIYAAILAILFIILSLRVIAVRRRERIAIGDGNNIDLIRAISVHNNFCQSVPLALILLTFNELQKAPALWLHFLCLLFITARFLHAYGVSQANENLHIRKCGMIMTFLTFILSAATIFIFRL